MYANAIVISTWWQSLAVDVGGSGRGSAPSGIGEQDFLLHVWGLVREVHHRENLRLRHHRNAGQFGFVLAVPRADSFLER